MTVTAWVKVVTAAPPEVEAERLYAAAIVCPAGAAPAEVATAAVATDATCTVVAKDTALVGTATLAIPPSVVVTVVIPPSVGVAVTVPVVVVGAVEAGAGVVVVVVVVVVEVVEPLLPPGDPPLLPPSQVVSEGLRVTSCVPVVAGIPEKVTEELLVPQVTVNPPLLVKVYLLAEVKVMLEVPPPSFSRVT